MAKIDHARIYRKLKDLAATHQADTLETSDWMSRLGAETTQMSKRLIGLSNQVSDLIRKTESRNSPQEHLTRALADIQGASNTFIKARLEMSQGISSFGSRLVGLSNKVTDLADLAQAIRSDVGTVVSALAPPDADARSIRQVLSDIMARVGTCEDYLRFGYAENKASLAKLADAKTPITSPILATIKEELDGQDSWIQDQLKDHTTQLLDRIDRRADMLTQQATGVASTVEYQGSETRKQLSDQLGMLADAVRGAQGFGPEANGAGAAKLITDRISELAGNITTLLGRQQVTAATEAEHHHKHETQIAALTELESTRYQNLWARFNSMGESLAELQKRSAERYETQSQQATILADALTETAKNLADRKTLTDLAETESTRYLNFWARFDVLDRDLKATSTNLDEQYAGLARAMADSETQATERHAELVKLIDTMGSRLDAIVDFQDRLWNEAHPKTTE